MNIDMLKKVMQEKLTEFCEKNKDNPSVFVDGKAHTVDEIMSEFEKSPLAQPGGISECADKFVNSVEKTSPKQEKAEYDIRQIIDEVHKELPAKPMLIFKPEAGKTGLFDSKLGGVPYLPKNFDYPKGTESPYRDVPLKLLAQLNFEQLPHIEPFPQKGILQFYCACDDDSYLYGADFDYPTKQNGFRIIYHENIITDVSQLMDESDMPVFDTSNGGFPFEGEFILKAEQPAQCKASIHDKFFYDLIMEKCSKLCGKELNNIFKLKNEGFGNIDFIYEENANESTCIGGYPYFTQDDVRFGGKFDDCNTLLLQIDSFYDKETKAEIMWGDMGIANFFIPEENLKKCDFTKVIYNWDCG